MKEDRFDPTNCCESTKDLRLSFLLQTPVTARARLADSNANSPLHRNNFGGGGGGSGGGVGSGVGGGGGGGSGAGGGGHLAVGGGATSKLTSSTLINNQLNSASAGVGNPYANPILGNLDKRIEKIEEIMKRRVLEEELRTERRREEEALGLEWSLIAQLIDRFCFIVYICIISLSPLILLKI